MSFDRMRVETKYYPHYLSRGNISHQANNKHATESQVTVEEVNHVLEVGSLLFSALIGEEIAELQRVLNSSSDEGNAGVA